MAEVFLHINADNIEKIQAQLDNIEKTISRIEKSGKTGFNFSGASRGLSSVEASAVKVERAFRNAGEAVSSLGRGMQSIGNAFGGKVVGTIKTMATAFATMGLYGAAQGTVQRYDTMRIFPKMMQHLGYSADEATKAVTKLEDAVIGLPTGLDEIVESARQLIPLTGDLNKGVNLAIAANNAFLAGGADAQSQRYGQRQIKDLLAKGTLRSQEWDSLFTALGSGLGVIAEQMGYSGKARKGALSTINDDLKYAESRLKSLRNTQKRLQQEGGTAKQVSKNQKALQAWQKEYDRLIKKQDKSLGSFRNALKTNQISALDFLDALEKAGTGEGELAKRADDYKETISAAARNIKNALQKMGAAGLDALDNVLMEKTGKGIPATIREISDSIKQNLIPSLEGWISSNGDKIMEFFDRLKNYDWGGLISKVGTGLAKYYDIITKFFSFFSPEFIGSIAVWAGPVGRVLQFAGGAIGGFGKLAATLIRVFGRGRAIDAAAEGARKFSKFTGSLKGAFQGLGLAAGITGEVALIGGVIFEYAKIIEAISNMDFGSNFDKNIGVISKTAGIGTGIASALTAIFGTLSNMFPSTFAPAAAAGEGLAAGLVAIVGEIGGVIAEYAHIVDYVANMDIPSQNRIKDLGKSIWSLNKNLIGKVKKVPSSKVRALDNLSEATEYAAKIAEKLKKLRDVGQIGDMSKRLDNIFKATDAVLASNYDKTDKKKSSRIKDVLANLADSMKSIGDVSSSLVGMQKNIDTLTKGGQATLMDNLASRMQAVVGKSQESLKKMQFATREMEDAKKNLQVISDGINSVANIAQTIVTAKQNIESITQIDEQGNTTSDVGSRMVGLISSIAGPLSKYHTLTGEYARAQGNMKRMSSMVTSIASIAKNLVESMNNIKTLMPDYKTFRDAERGNNPTSDMMARLKPILDEITGLAKSIEKYDIDTNGDAKEKMEALANAIVPIKSIIDNLGQIKEPLKGLGVSGEDWPLGTDLNTLVKGVRDAFGGLSSEDYADLKTNAESLASAVGYLDSIMTSLKKVQDNIGGLGVEGGTWQAGEDLGTALNTITGMFGDQLQSANAQSMLTNVATNLVAVAEQIKVIAENAANAATGLNDAAGGMKALGDACSNQKGAIEGAASAAKQLKSGVDGIALKAAGAAGGITILGWSAKNQVDNLNRAATAASNLASAINNIPTNKTVNVQTNTGGGLFGKIKNALGFARGGEVRGPGGVDNVRAWLTNGEFVMRRAAHKKFGTGFMNRINNLDVDGAIRALSIRAGAGVFSKGGVVTNNYSRDNHANVTFNIGRASQGYSQRRANRWARALS